MSEKWFGASAIQGACYIYLHKHSDGTESPQLLIGSLKANKTVRPFTPKCASGFACGLGTQGNPFEYGHVMGWDLGGPNVPENIVPLYGRWQANKSSGGAPKTWRDMEVDIAKLTKGNLFVAIIEYPAGSSKSLAEQTKDFVEFRQLFDWSVEQVPNKLHVYVEPETSTFGQKLVKQFLDPKVEEKERTVLRAELLTDTYNGTPVNNWAWDHSKLPFQDKDFLIRNMTALAVDDTMNEREIAKQLERAANKTLLQGMKTDEGKMEIDDMHLQDLWADMPQSPAHTETYFIINEHDDDVRKKLKTTYMMDAPTADSVTKATMHRASLHENPKARDVKLWVKRRDEVKAQRKEAIDVARKDKRYDKYLKSRQDAAIGVNK